jgi:hypothetical protein
VLGGANTMWWDGPLSHHARSRRRRHLAVAPPPLAAPAACQPVSADHHESDSAVRSATAVGLQRVCCGEAGRSRASIIPAWAARGVCVSSAFRTGGCHCVQSCRRAHRGRPSWWGSTSARLSSIRPPRRHWRAPPRRCWTRRRRRSTCGQCWCFRHKQRVRIYPDLCV